MKNINELESKPIWKLLLKYSIPSMIASSIHALYNIVDRMYIGKVLGSKALAGVTLTFPIFILSIAIGVLISSGASSLISLKLGKHDKKDATKTLGNTITLFIIIGIFVTSSILPFLTPLLKIIGGTETTIPYAYNYLIYFLPFMMFDFIAMGTNGSIRSEGNPTRAMIIAISGAFLNIILDPIFLFVFDMGVSGVAIATSISRVITTILVIWHFTFSKKRYLTLSFSSMKLDFKIIKDIIRIGSSPFFMMLATTFVAVFSNRALAKFGGDEGLSSLGAISSIFMIVETFLYGLMMGSQPVIGYNYGAKLKKRVYEALKYAYIYATSIAIVGLLFILLFSGPLVSIFSKGDKEFMIVAENGLKIFMSMIPFVAIHMMSVMYFQATGQALKSIILNLSRKTFFYLPALFIMPRFLDLNGIWIATPIADFLSCLVAISFIFYEFQKEYKSNEIKSDTLLI